MSSLQPAVDWDRVEAVVFDVDGTLYDQRCLRGKILLDLLISCLRRPAMVQTIRRLQTFRRVREELAKRERPGIARLQFEEAARRLNCSSELLEAEVEDWIYRRPLVHLPRCRFKGVSRFFDVLRSSGRRIAVWSDYPAVEKLKVLGLEAEVVVSGQDPEVDRLKPHPAGLRQALDRLGLDPGSILVVGDRQERDAAAADRAGAPWLLKARAKRREQNQFESFEELIADLEAAARSHR